jgi:hypothetical protein
MANQMLLGQICVTDLIEKLQEFHPCFEKKRDGKVYAKLSVYINSKPFNGTDAKVSLFSLLESQICPIGGFNFYDGDNYTKFEALQIKANFDGMFDDKKKQKLDENSKTLFSQ